MTCLEFDICKLDVIQDLKSLDFLQVKILKMFSV